MFCKLYASNSKSNVNSFRSFNLGDYIQLDPFM